MIEFSPLSITLVVAAMASGPFYLFANYHYAGVSLRQTLTMTAGLLIFASAIVWFVFVGQFMFANPYVMPAVMLTSLAIPPLLVLAFPNYFVPPGIGLGWLMGVQAFRLIGGLYLFEHFRGNVGTAFGYWAGIGDVLTGILASVLVLQYLITGSMSQRVAFWTIIFGLADFAWAYAIGVLSFETPLQVFAFGEVHATNLFPLAMIPFLLAPIAMAYMVMTLIKLKRS